MDSKALYLGLSYVSAHIPPLWGQKEVFLVPAFPWAPTRGAARQGADFRHMPLFMASRTVVFSSMQWGFGDSKIRITVRGETAPSPAQL